MRRLWAAMRAPETESAETGRESVELLCSTNQAVFDTDFPVSLHENGVIDQFIVCG